MPRHDCTNAATGDVTGTRIDRIYAPDRDGLIWEHKTGQDIFGWRRDALEIDHEKVQITIRNVGDVKRGSDLKKIEEYIFDDQKFLDKVAEQIEDIIELEQPTHGTWRSTWNKIENAVRHMGLEETKARRTTDNEEIKKLKLKQHTLKTLIDTGQATASHITQYT